MRSGLIFFLALFSSLARGGDLESVKKAGRLRLATEGAFAPFNYFKGAELTGFEVDLGNEVAQRLGVKPEWTQLSFDSLLIGLGQNRYDVVIASHAITPERARAVDFSDPHYCSGAVIVSKGPNGPQTTAALKGKVVSAQVGTVYVPVLQKIPGIGAVKTFQKDTDSFQALLAGKLDATVVDRFVALEMKRNNPQAQLQLGEQLTVERIAMALAKGNTSLKEAINGALKALLKDGTYERISKKYFGQDIRCR